MSHLVLYTVGKLAHAYSDPEIRVNFELMAHKIYETVEKTNGLVRNIRFDGTEPAPSVIDTGVDFPIYTLTIWTSIQSAFEFSYGGIHRDALRNRHKWFEKKTFPPLVMWWVDEGENVSWVDAVDRYECYLKNGPSPYAFDFNTSFDASEI